MSQNSSIAADDEKTHRLQADGFEASRGFEQDLREVADALQYDGATTGFLSKHRVIHSHEVSWE